MPNQELENAGAVMERITVLGNELSESLRLTAHKFKMLTENAALFYAKNRLVNESMAVGIVQWQETNRKIMLNNIAMRENLGLSNSYNKKLREKIRLTNQYTAATNAGTAAAIASNVAGDWGNVSSAVGLGLKLAKISAMGVEKAALAANTGAIKANATAQGISNAKKAKAVMLATFGTGAAIVAASIAMGAVMMSRIPQFASGGFPNSGQMFIARENGIPEMVGNIGGHTAVANNDQIVQAVAQGVSSAVYPAVYKAILDASSQTGGGTGGDIVVTLNGEELLRAVDGEYARQGRGDRL